MPQEYRAFLLECLQEIHPKCSNRNAFCKQPSLSYIARVFCDSQQLPKLQGSRHVRIPEVDEPFASGV